MHPYSPEPLEPRIAPAGASIDVASLNGTNGLRVDGTGAEHYAGTAVAGVGDVNNDGIDDFILSERHLQTGEGRAFVVFGKTGAFPPTLNPATLDGSAGFRISGLGSADDFFTPAVAGAGDVNGDTIDDLLVTDREAAYVIFGKATGFTADVSVAALNGVEGFRIGGARGAGLVEAAGAGDVNGDNIDDVIFSPDVEGRVFVVFGKRTGFDPLVNVTTLNGTDGFGIDLPQDNGFPLRHVSGAGDLNGDGIADLAIGARVFSSDPTAYVIFGHGGSFAPSISTASLDGTNGFRLLGDGQVPPAMVGLGPDVNGDGFDDLVTSAAVVFGHSSPFAPSLSVSDLNGSNGFKIQLLESAMPPDHTVAGAGDFNGDGYADIVIGLNNRDVATLLLGKATFEGDTILVDPFGNSPGQMTIVLPPDSTRETFRRTAGAAGDVNGDGLDDLIVGARSADINGANSGAAYVIFGSPPALSVSDVSLAEGISGTAFASFTVALSGALDHSVSVFVSTSDGTATAGEDYNAVLLTELIFAPGEMEKTVQVAVLGDRKFELDETFSVSLSNASGAPIQDEAGVGTIRNDDGRPTILLTPEGGYTITEPFQGDSVKTLRVSLTNPSSQTVTVSIATSDGSAVASADYASLQGAVVTFAPGELDKLVDVRVHADATYEGEESFVVRLSNPQNADIGVGSADITIRDSNPPPAIRVSDSAVNEGNSSAVPAVFTVSLSVASSKPVIVRYLTTDGTATAPDDYAALPVTNLTFAPGEVTKSVTVQVAADSVPEAHESFFLNLANPTGGTIEDAQGQGTIINDDPLPDLTINDVSLNEGANGTAMATFTIVLSRVSGQPVTVRYATGNGTAAAPGDYAALPPTTLTFAPGETSKTVTVNVRGDTVFEPNENFFLNLSNVTNAVLADAQGVATILNDESVPLLTIGDVNISEGQDGTAQATFAVTLSGPSSQAVSVQCATANGTATAPEDYALVPSDMLVFAPGETSKTIAVFVNGDDVFESDETFSLELSDAAGAGISDSSGRATILNDEAEPTVSISDVSLVETIRGITSAVFTVTLSGPSSESVSVQYASADGTAEAGSDYRVMEPATLLFAPGEVSRTIEVEVTGDTATEADETFFVNLTAPSNATLADAEGEATIRNDDVAVSISGDGKKARFTDIDGDHIIVKTSRGKFVAENFVFRPAGNWAVLDLRAPETTPGFTAAQLSIAAQTPADGSGDGFVSLAAIDALGLRLKTVKIDGALGQIDVGEGRLGKSALKTLTVQSLGPGAPVGEESTIAGTLGTFKSRGDLTGVLNVTGGATDPAVNFAGIAIKKVLIGGDLDGREGGQRAGLIDAAGDIGTVLVKGSVHGGGTMSGIISGGSIDAITVAGNLTGNASVPVRISALGTVGAKTAAGAVALRSLDVGGGVLHAQVLAGYSRALTPSNGVASIGSIDVAGSWNASSAVAGVADLTGDGFGQNDAPIGGLVSPGVLARIAKVTIHGIAAGSTATGDFFGITAQQLGRVLAGSIRPPLGAGSDGFLLDPLNNDFRVVDFA